MNKIVYCSVSWSALIAVLIVIQTVIKICSGQLQYRLDKTVFPESYDIKVKPYLFEEDGKKQFTFDGEVNITLHAAQQNMKIITLHKNNIDILEADLYAFVSGIEKSVQNFNITNMTFEKETDKLNLSLKEALNIETKYVLHFRYSGLICNNMAGFFYASYFDADGKTKWIALTQSQRINARTIVPCWDEPAFKAKFRLQISRPKEYNSVFNTRLASSKVDAHDLNRYLDTFEWTPVMSSYLVAFMISQYIKRGDEDLVILSRPEYIKYTEFTYNVTKKTVEAYNNYTKLPYKELGNTIMQKASSPKFPYNGMENWGLVLYRDSVLVQEQDYSDGWKDKQYSITILVHETAHMWFGNSVTFAWWSFFWLNEGFARYYQYFLGHEIYPEYQLDQQFIVNQLQMIFEKDALNTTLPLSTPEHLVQTPSEIANMFSSIAYAKGASIIRMFRNLMGHENFDLAIQEYLSEFHLKNTVPTDLFKHLKQHWPKEQQVDLDIFFHDWTEQVGFPFLIVNMSNDRKQITLKQRRFLLSSDGSSNANLRYTLPITYTTNLENNFDDLSPKIFFNASTESLSIRLKEPINWIIFNIQQSNFFRVHYDVKMLGDIYVSLKNPQHSGIHVINRAQIIDDIFNFAHIGIMDYTEVFKFLEYLVYEMDYLPWQATLTSLPRISQRLTVKQQTNFGKFINDVTSKVYQKLGFQSNNNTVLDVYNRNNIVYWTCKYKNTKCNQEAQANLLKAVKSKKWITTDLRETVYCSAIRFGEFRMYEIIDKLYQNENRTSEKELLLRTLGCTLYFMDYHYARILAGHFQEYIRLTLKPLYAENPENIAPMLNTIISTYSRLAEILGSFSSLADVISDLCNYITTEKEQQALECFIFEHGLDFGESIKILQKASETVKNNLKWAEDRLGKLVIYLESRNSAPLSSPLSVIWMVLSLNVFKVIYWSKILLID